MGDAIFPTLAGLKWGIQKTPIFSTLIQRASSGMESRASLYVYPLWQYNLSYELLRDNALNNELKTLIGFYLSRYGAKDSFLYKDPDDYIVTGQAIGTGDGITTVFPFFRTYGGFVEPVSDVIQPAGSPATPDLNVYVAGVKRVGGYVITYLGGDAKITFTSPIPSAGQAITADFSFYKRVRFIEYSEGSGDSFTQFMRNLWELGSLSFITAR